MSKHLTGTAAVIGNVTVNGEESQGVFVQINFEDARASGVQIGAVWGERVALVPVTAEPPETQATITAWADSVFGPNKGPAATLLRAVNELVEACIAAGVTAEDIHGRVDAEFSRQVQKGSAEDLANLPAEVAGTAIVLFRVAQAGGFDLQDAINTEMRRNRGRQQFAAGNGVGYHAAPEASHG